MPPDFVVICDLIFVARDPLRSITVQPFEAWPAVDTVVRVLVLRDASAVVHAHRDGLVAEQARKIFSVLQLQLVGGHADEDNVGRLRHEEEADGGVSAALGRHVIGEIDRVAVLSDKCVCHRKRLVSSVKPIIACRRVIEPYVRRVPFVLVCGVGERVVQVMFILLALRLPRELGLVAVFQLIAAVEATPAHAAGAPSGSVGRSLVGERLVAV
mmetsp:Transcript_25278/g.58771  ORF Transcript_25278/g.58771 Transcript_25278/m.58771 type:complete len:213 (-) Transcript_25278:5768-6406(-)